jgi:hypothetical protein
MIAKTRTMIAFQVGSEELAALDAAVALAPALSRSLVARAACLAALPSLTPESLTEAAASRWTRKVTAT